MNKGMIIATAISVLITGSVCFSQDPALEPAADKTQEPALDHGHGLVHTATCLQCMTERDTLTDNWFGLGEKLSDEGLTVGLGLINIYQINSRGGISTHRHSGRYTGHYNLEIGADMAKLLGIRGGSVHASAEGGWSHGIDEPSIGSVFGVNASAIGNRSIDLTQLYYQQELLGGTLIARVGKLDLTGGFECRGCPVTFDGNSFANDETAQFLNGALVNNPTIPFPQNGIGAIVYYNPIEWWYISAGMADAQADKRETGFNTAFHDEDYFFYIAETGVTPQFDSANGALQGAYRVGVWYDPQPKEKYGTASTTIVGGEVPETVIVPASMKRDDVGFYVSADQMIFKENDDAKDTQGMGLFARYGFAHSDVNPINCFWSLGGQYQGLIPSRDNDVLGAGIAQGKLVSKAGFTEHRETASEVYYNVQITPWLHVSPSVQYICNPGISAESNALVFGVRAQLTF